MYPIRQLLPFMYLNFSLFCSRHTNEHKYSHMPLSNKAEKWDEVDRITSAAYSLDSVLPVLTSGPPTQTPGNTGTVFSITKNWRQSFSPPNLWVNELWCMGFSFKRTFNFQCVCCVTVFKPRYYRIQCKDVHNDSSSATFSQHKPPHEPKHT